jgi:uncharacterized protein (DUF1499 family)
LSDTGVVPMLAGVGCGLLIVAATEALAAGFEGDQLAGCGETPNCVSSQAQGPRHIAAFKLKTGRQAWPALEQLLAQTPRVKVVTRTDDYLHAEFVSALLRFTDDVEFQLRESEGIIAVRSASRVGYYDFGANRGRIEKLRERLRAAGAIE